MKSLEEIKHGARVVTANGTEWTFVRWPSRGDTHMICVSPDTVVKVMRVPVSVVTAYQNIDRYEPMRKVEDA